MNWATPYRHYRHTSPHVAQRRPILPPASAPDAPPPPPDRTPDQTPSHCPSSSDTADSRVNTVKSDGLYLKAKWGDGGKLVFEPDSEKIMLDILTFILSTRVGETSEITRVDKDDQLPPYPGLPAKEGDKKDMVKGCCHNSLDTSVQALNVLTPYPYPNMGINRISIRSHFQYRLVH